jgi:carboxyl-terminal processing protease
METKMPRPKALWTVLVWLASIPFLAAAEPQGTPQTSPPVKRDRDAFFARVLTITDLVLAQHVDPPTRQQMLLAGTKGLFAAAKVSAPLGLSRRLSELATREQCAQFLEETWPQAAGTAFSLDLQMAALDELLNSIPGDSRLTTIKDLMVHEQFAGNRYVGIGIQLRRGGNEKPQIAGDFARGPARKAGAKAGDTIEEIDGTPTEGLELSKVVDLLRGPEGTVVTIVVRQPEEATPRKLQITRGVIPRETVVGYQKFSEEDWGFRVDPAAPIAFVKLREIGASSLHELRKIEQQLRASGVRALMLDLRGVQSGSLQSTVALADGLLERGSIGRVRTADGVREFTADADCLFRKWPLAVLVDKSTSNMGEWLAAALQDNQRAFVVGEQTRGGGYTYESFRMDDGEFALTLANGILERADGRPLLQTEHAAIGPRPLRRQGVGETEPPASWDVRPDYSIPPEMDPILMVRTASGIVPAIVAPTPGAAVTARPVELRDPVKIALQQLKERLARVE